MTRLVLACAIVVGSSLAGLALGCGPAATQAEVKALDKLCAARAYQLGEAGAPP